jgi:tRNA-dihydrouridine synthase B
LSLRERLLSFLHPLDVAGVRLCGNLFYAPIAGYSDWPARCLCKEKGAALAVTEFVAVEGLIRDSRRTLEYLRFRPEELPLSAQIYGDTPEHVPAAARIIEDLGFSFLDINMGCPTRKVCRHGAGSALLLDPGRAVAMVAAAVSAVGIPVTVKMRLGFNAGERTAVALAPRFEQAGAALITVHGRTAKQGFSGRADWSGIREVKATVAVPVIGNGDVIDPESALALFEQTGCDGIMIGRAALGNPWIFEDILRADQAAASAPQFHRPDFPAVLERHLRMMADCYVERLAVVLFRKHAVRYLKGLPGAAKVKERICHIDSVAEMLGVIRKLEVQEV